MGVWRGASHVQVGRRNRVDPTHALLYCTGFVRRARFEEQITTLHDSATTFFKGNERECVLDLLEMASCIPSPR